jgi:hypothetical protein
MDEGRKRGKKRSKIRLTRKAIMNQTKEGTTRKWTLDLSRVQGGHMHEAVLGMEGGG